MSGTTSERRLGAAMMLSDIRLTIGSLALCFIGSAHAQESLDKGRTGPSFTHPIALGVTAKRNQDYRGFGARNLPGRALGRQP
jgi:hypothetical protein